MLFAAGRLPGFLAFMVFVGPSELAELAAHATCRGVLGDPESASEQRDAGDHGGGSRPLPQEGVGDQRVPLSRWFFHCDGNDAQ